MVGIIHPEKSTRGNDPVVQTEVSQARPSDLALSLLNESRFLTNHLLWPLSPFAQPPQREKIRDRGKVLSNSVPVNMDSSFRVRNKSGMFDCFRVARDTTAIPDHPLLALSAVA